LEGEPTNKKRPKDRSLSAAILTRARRLLKGLKSLSAVERKEGNPHFIWPCILKIPVENTPE